MRRRHPPLPQLWLMTDERMGEALWEALERLPAGSGVVFRHYALPLAERCALFARIARVARRRRLVLLRAGSARLGRSEAGTHGTKRRERGLYTRPAHSRREAIAAIRAGADAVFVSPLFATRSHPGARTLGTVRFGLLIRGLDAPVIALGGMDAGRAASLWQTGVYGWSAIDAWTPGAS
ncbi:MAG: thiamine phosphate synthase [Sphingomonas sp.]